ncbi:hypothetical protein G9464_19990 [Halostella sp. JP-L12]|uniref:DUF7521 family protein n=1 Tax=Halostella TaxID=1843185 RepID=UPI000EF815A4|nr:MULTISPECIES: hypothetical protein [Halostella]NHN49853.1 hypothetical protein [Halostella sp. JP-L12]
MYPQELVIVASKTATLLCGGLVTTLAYRAYLRTRSPALRALAFGLGFVTVGALIAGGLHQLVGVPIETGIAVQGAFTALGFVVLAYSLYANSATEESRSPVSGDEIGR